MDFLTFLYKAFHLFPCLCERGHLWWTSRFPSGSVGMKGWFHVGFKGTGQWMRYTGNFQLCLAFKFPRKSPTYSQGNQCQDWRAFGRDTPRRGCATFPRVCWWSVNAKEKATLIMSSIFHRWVTSEDFRPRDARGTNPLPNLEFVAIRPSNSAALGDRGHMHNSNLFSPSTVNIPVASVLENIGYCCRDLSRLGLPEKQTSFMVHGRRARNSWEFTHPVQSQRFRQHCWV